MIFFALIGLIWGAAPAYSEESSSSTVEVAEPSYLLSQPITAGLRLGFPSYVFSVSVDDSDAFQKVEKNVDYSPTPGTEMTLSAGYGDYALSWKRPLPPSESKKRTYGGSSYYDLRLELAKERYAVGVFHQKYSGFHTDLNGSGNFVRSGFGDSGNSNFPSEPLSRGPSDIRKRPDIKARHTGLIGYYAIPALDEDTQSFLLSFQSGPEKPRRGWGLDIVTNGTYNLADVVGDMPFVPAQRSEIFGQGATLKAIRMQSIGSGAGVASSYVFDGQRAYIDGILLLGGGLQRQRSIFAEEKKTRSAFVSSVHMKIGFSYRGDNHTFGLKLAVDNWSAKTANVRFNSSNLALDMGYTLAI